MRTGFGNHGLAQFPHLLLRDLLRHERLDDLDFLEFLRSKLRTIVVRVNLGGLVALLDHLHQDLHDFVVGHRILAGAAMGDIAVLDRRLDQTHGRGPAHILGLQRLFQRIGEYIA